MGFSAILKLADLRSLNIGARKEPNLFQIPISYVTPSFAAQKSPQSPQTITIRCFAMDYDGTISPIDATRTESNVPEKTLKLLREIHELIPVAILTTKDLGFIKSRVPFASAWSAVGGLETQVGNRITKTDSFQSTTSTISQAVSLVKSYITCEGFEIEEKKDSEGQTIAFCIDWRRANKPRIAMKKARKIVDYTESLGLLTVKQQDQPFVDVFSALPDKGRALKQILSELGIHDGVLYMGDSEADNPAFRNSNLSIGVVESETKANDLDSDFVVNFEDVPVFLEHIVRNDLQFSSDFPEIKANPARRIKKTGDPGKKLSISRSNSKALSGKSS